MESWLSGLKRLTANEVRANPLRGFESLTLRKIRSRCDSIGDYILRESEGFEPRAGEARRRRQPERGSGSRDFL